MTNGSSVFKSFMGDHSFDSIVFSIDGIDQNSYHEYRVKGKYNRSLQFATDVVKSDRSQSKKTLHVWKYILFNHNDSFSQLESLYEQASNAGVDELRLVVTQYGPVSPKFLSYSLGLESKRGSTRTLCDINDTISIGEFNRLSLNKLADDNVVPDIYFSGSIPVTVSFVVTPDTNLISALNLAESWILRNNLNNARYFIEHFINMMWLLYKDLDDKKIHPSHQEMLNMCKKYCKSSGLDTSDLSNMKLQQLEDGVSQRRANLSGEVISIKS